MARRGLRGKIVAAISVAAAVLLVFYFWRDLNLSRTVDLEKLPDVIVEDLTFDRTIDGKDWNIKATRAEHRQGLITASDLDIHVKEPASGRSSHVMARSGDFTQESGNLSLTSVDGIASLGDRSVDWRAPVASYDSSLDLWTFERGIVARDRSAVVSGEYATITSGNIFKIEKGAEARWNVKE